MQMLGNFEQGMDKWNHKLEIMLQEAAVAYFRASLQNYPRRRT
jgi:hypothetical protein